MQLNKDNEYASFEKYKEFYGRNVGQMPKLIAEGRIPLSIADLMKRRLEFRDSDVNSSWLDNYFDAGDSVVYHPKGNLKIVLDSKLLRQINSNSSLRNGALVLEDGVYEKLEGQEFTRKELEEYVEKPLTKKQVKENPLWRTLARGQNLLNEYADFIFTEAKDKFDYTENMRVYLGSASDDSNLCAWYFSGLVDGSYVDGGCVLGADLGRFVGLAPEAHRSGS